MSSNHPNRPPGISSHNVKVDFDVIDDSEDVSGLAETTESIDDISVARVNFYSILLEPESSPTSPVRRTRNDDFLAERAMHDLEQILPYPGDESPEEGRRFLVYQFEEL
jgi:hypothetical protein